MKKLKDIVLVLLIVTCGYLMFKTYSLQNKINAIEKTTKENRKEINNHSDIFSSIWSQIYKLQHGVIDQDD